jgi:hypothetical protein
MLLGQTAICFVAAVQTVNDKVTHASKRKAPFSEFEEALSTGACKQNSK